MNGNVFECPVCNEMYNDSLNKPFCLQCGHTLCIKCLNQLAETKCPIDNQPIQNKFPNYSLVPGFKQIAPSCKQTNTDDIVSINVTRKIRSNRLHADGLFENYEKILLEILESDSIIFNMESKFGKIGSQSKFFIRVLVTAVCQHYLELMKNHVDSIKFKTLSNILSIFIKKNKEFELEGLFAIQELDKKIQIDPDHLQSIFGMLFKEKIISSDVFLAWKLLIGENNHVFSHLFQTGLFDQFHKPLNRSSDYGYEKEHPLSNTFFI